jgi:hypothetical protein
MGTATYRTGNGVQEGRDDTVHAFSNSVQQTRKLPVHKPLSLPQEKEYLPPTKYEL